MIYLPIALIHFILIIPEVTRLLFKYSNIFILWNGSLGHTVCSTDAFYRTIFPQKGLTIQVNHNRTNPYVSNIYENSNLFLINLPSFIKSNKNQYSYGRILYNIVRAYLNFFSSLNPRLYIYDRARVYSILHSENTNLKCGDLEHNKIVDYNNLTGWYFLMRNKKINIELNKEVFSEFKYKELYRKIKNKSYVYITLRNKNESSLADDYIRDAGPMNNYIEAIKFLSSKFDYIFLQMDLIDDSVKKINNLLIVNELFENEKEFKINQIKLMSNAKFFIGQQSGPTNLAPIFQVPVLVLDGLPYWQGLIYKHDLCLFKNTYLDGKKIVYEDLLNNHRDLVFLFTYHQTKYQLVDNTEREILETVKYFYKQYETKIIDDKYVAMVSDIRENISHNYLAKYMINQISKFNLE